MGYSFYWILLAYLAIGYFYPVIGLLALVCMIAPVAFAVSQGRWWCGNACPRGNMYDRLLAKYSPHRPIPTFVRTFGFRLFMVLFIFTVFGVQMYFAWGDWNAMGRVFWNIIAIRGRHTLLHLCSAHLVFVLSDGNSFFVGDTEETRIPEGIHKCPR